MGTFGFSVRIEQVDGTVVVRPSGELDVLTAPQLDRVLESVVGHFGAVVLDMSGVRFVDCAGLTPIRRALEGQSRTSVRVVDAQPKVERVLRLTGLHRQVTASHG